MKRRIFAGFVIILMLFMSIALAMATITPNPTSWVKYNGTGAQLTFPYTWKIYASTDLQVIVTDSTGDHLKTLTTDYSVTGVGATAGGNVVFGSAPATGSTVFITVNLPLKQDLHYIPNAPFPAISSEVALDRLAMEIRQYAARTPMLSSQKPSRDLTFPAPALSSIIGWDATGTALQTYPTTSVAVPTIDYLGNYGNSLATAVATIGSAPTLLQITQGTTVSADLNVPANITLWPSPAGVITVATTKTLTINGPFEAGLCQVFSCSGSGKVAFGVGTVKEIYPEWWGAVGDGVANDTVPVQAAFTTAYDMQTLLYATTSYFVVTPVVFTRIYAIKPISLRGMVSMKGTHFPTFSGSPALLAFDYTATDNMFTLIGNSGGESASLTVTDLTFSRNAATNNIFYIPKVNPVSGLTQSANSIYITHCHFGGSAAAGNIFNMENGGDVEFSNNVVDVVGSGVVIRLGTVTDVRINSNEIYSVPYFLLVDDYVTGVATGNTFTAGHNGAYFAFLNDKPVGTPVETVFSITGNKIEGTQTQYGVFTVGDGYMRLTSGQNIYANLLSAFYDGGTAYAAPMDIMSNGDIFGTDCTNRIFYAAGTTNGLTYYGDIYPSFGTTAERPVLHAGNAGFTFWDTTLSQLISWNGTAWTPTTTATPAMPATTVEQRNTNAYPVRVTITGGTVTVIAKGPTTGALVTTGATAGAFILQPNEYIAITYSAAPTWVWLGM